MENTNKKNTVQNKKYEETNRRLKTDLEHYKVRLNECIRQYSRFEKAIHKSVSENKLKD